MPNKVFSRKEASTINATTMKQSEFGIVRAKADYAKIEIGHHVLKTDCCRIICLETGCSSTHLSSYSIELKDTLNLQKKPL